MRTSSGTRSQWVLTALLVVGLLRASSLAQAPQSRPYVIGPQDVLLVTVFNQPEATGRFPVGADGTVTFPLLGRVKAAGLTVREFEAALTTSLSAGFFRNPVVTVSIDAYRSQQFSVSGEVRQPGTFFLSGQETLIQALAQAGSTTADAGSEIMIVHSRHRPGEAGPIRPDQAAADQILKIDLDKLSSGALENNVAIEDGDTIFVPKAEPVYILGQVRNPGPYRLTKTLTVLQLISMAGGVTERGASNRTQVIRMVDGKRKQFKIALSDVLKPNDTIVVPEKFW
jgi:polysaccharide export outer membrane protein